jgi:hypothetical protein
MPNPEQHGWTLSDVQRFREESEMSRRLYQVAREHKMRKLLGNDVYDFVHGSRMWEIIDEEKP